MIEPGIILSIALSGIGALVWAVRVEGKVNGHDKTFADLNKLLEERDEHVKDRHLELANRLSRIEAKIDRGFSNDKEIR